MGTANTLNGLFAKSIVAIHKYNTYTLLYQRIFSNNNEHQARMLVCIVGSNCGSTKERVLSLTESSM